jgi:hypothetical protein
VALFVDAFPAEGPLVILDQFAAGDRVVPRFHSRPRHEKQFFGLAAARRLLLFNETHESSRTS